MLNKLSRKGGGKDHHNPPPFCAKIQNGTVIQILAQTIFTTLNMTKGHNVSVRPM